MEDSFPYCGYDSPEGHTWLDELEQVRNAKCPERRVARDGWTSKGRHPLAVRKHGYLPTVFDLGDLKSLEGDAESSPEDAVDVTDWLSAYSCDPEAVSRFCAGKDLAPQLKIALKLARKAFPAYNKLSLRVEKDPESEDEWVDVNVALGVSDSQVVEHYEQWVADWVQATDPQSRESIHLTFHFD